MPTGSQCPICKSNFNATGPTGPDPLWVDDPVKTPRGLAGEEYTGITPIRHYHIQQLQNYYQYVLTQVGLPPVEMISVDNTKSPTHTHIEQLRIIIENILDNAGLTIADYFKSNKYGETYTTTQTDWTDVDRSSGKPLLPVSLDVKAIHIEELRRGMIVGFPYLFCSSSTGPRWGGSSISECSVQGIGKKGVDPNQYFNHFSTVFSDDTNTGYSRTVNNMDECLIEQRGVIHIISARRDLPEGSHSARWGTPMYSYIKATEMEKLYGYYGDYATQSDSYIKSHDQVKFDPALPGGEDTGGGIFSLAIDDSGDDYVMYTSEYFKSGESYNLIDLLPSSIVKYVYPQRRTLGTSTGASNQTFDASSVGIYTPMIDQSEVVTVDNYEWIRVDDFLTSTPTSSHYTINYSTGVVTFGNGTQGKIPPKDSVIKIWILLTGGGVWAKVETVVSEEAGTFYYGVQARGGKLWYMRSYHCLSAIQVQITRVNSLMKGDLDDFLDWPTTPPKNPSDSPWWLGQTWEFNYINRAGNWLRIQGQATYNTQLRNPGMKDSGILIGSDGLLGRYGQTTPPGGWLQPNVYDDSPNFDMRFADPNEAGLHDLVSVVYLQDDPVIRTVSSEAVYWMGLHETRLTGYYQWVPGTGWVWHSDPQASLHCWATYYTNYGGVPITEDYAFVIQIGDQIRSYGGTEWDQYKEWSYRGSYYYQAESPGEGAVFTGYYERGDHTHSSDYTRWRIGEGTSNFYRYYYSKYVKGSSTRLSTVIPLKIVFHHPEIDDDLLTARGGTPYAAYDTTYEITSLEV